MPRILLFGVAWIAVLAAIALGVRRVTPVVSTEVQSVRTQSAPPPKAGQRFPGWTVTRAYSAHRMMVIEIETEFPANGRRMAAEMVEPMKDRYDEVLVYVRTPGWPEDSLPPRRIQWTQGDGYVEAIYAEDPPVPRKGLSRPEADPATKQPERER